MFTEKQKQLMELMDRDVIGFKNEKYDYAKIAAWNGNHTVNIYGANSFSEIDMFTFGHALTDKSAKKEQAIDKMRGRGYTVFTKE